VNTDAVPAPEERNDDAQTDIIRNDVEARLVTQILEAMLSGGVPAHQVGVISPWRAQLKTIHYHLSHRHIPGIEVLTVDKYQGRDKDCIIISLVRSNPQKNVRLSLKRAIFLDVLCADFIHLYQVGSLLRDWRRVNVAFTRAKKKLIVFGSRSTMEGNHLLKAFLEIIDEKKWEYSLPVDAIHMYDFGTSFKPPVTPATSTSNPNSPAKRSTQQQYSSGTRL
jgi:DNA replication ATP-dependent helicase Dna2